MLWLSPRIRHPWVNCAPSLTYLLDPCYDLCIVNLHHWWCFNLNCWVKKWVRVYVSLKLFKRGDPPIVIHELWHQNWNKEILSGTTLLSTCLMNEWGDDWHYFSSALRYIRHSFCIFPSTRLTCKLKEVILREAHWWGDLPCCLISTIGYQGVELVFYFFFLYFF